MWQAGVVTFTPRSPFANGANAFILLHIIAHLAKVLLVTNTLAVTDADIHNGPMAGHEGKSP